MPAAFNCARVKVRVRRRYARQKQHIYAQHDTVMWSDHCSIWRNDKDTSKLKKWKRQKRADTNWDTISTYGICWKLDEYDWKHSSEEIIKLLHESKEPAFAKQDNTTLASERGGGISVDRETIASRNFSKKQFDSVMSKRDWLKQYSKEWTATHCVGVRTRVLS